LFIGEQHVADPSNNVEDEYDPYTVEAYDCLVDTSGSIPGLLRARKVPEGDCYSCESRRQTQVVVLRPFL
jgi:hypothetical protein